MRKIKSYKGLLAWHVEKFGVEPVITGFNAMNERPIFDLILESIEAGKPYVEPPVPKGALV